VSEAVTFFVPGVPQPGGSKKGFVVKTKSGGLRANVVEDAKRNAPWRAVVSLAGSEAFLVPLTGPLSVSFSFAMPRPGSHYGTGRNADKLKPSSPAGHTSKPDITKLIRSTEDALKGIAWVDDSQIVSQSAGKMYTNDRRPGCWIMIQPFNEGGDAFCRTSALDDSDQAPAATGAPISPAQPALFEERT
jgi:Holliday junction resolvase RusA-like endonuclease